MNAQEQGMLQGLIERVTKTQLTDKDPDAVGMLENSLGRNPDSLYILAQTVLVQGYALEQAQKQLADLRAQAEQMRQQVQTQSQAPVKHTSFLGSLLGRDEEVARPVPPPPPPVQSQYAPVPSYPAPSGYQPSTGFGQPGAYGAGQPGGYGAPPQGGGFLRGAMQTAAGVAAGALAFEGVESLMHGFGHAAGYGSGLGGFGGGGGFEGGGFGGPREEVINNYYGDSAGGGEHQGGAQFGGGGTGDVPSQDNLSGFDDTPGSGASNFADAPDSSGGDDSADSFDPGDDSGGVDDSGGGFDSGGDDSGGGFDSGDSGSGDGF